MSRTTQTGSIRIREQRSPPTSFLVSEAQQAPEMALRVFNGENAEVPEDDLSPRLYHLSPSSLKRVPLPVRQFFKRTSRNGYK